MDYDEYIIERVDAWNKYSKNPFKIPRLIKKSKIKDIYPFTARALTYGFKHKSQEKPYSDDQTFMVAYAYVYDNYINNKEAEFIKTVNNIGLRFFKERIMYNGRDYYRILIVDKKVDLHCALQLIRKQFTGITI